MESSSIRGDGSSPAITSPCSASRPRSEECSTPAADSITGGAAPLAISYGYWQRRFHGDRGVIGQNVTVDGARFTIVGVAPESFTGDIVEQRADLWIPLGMHDVMRPHSPVLRDPFTSWLLLLGRLKPGVTTAQARTELGPLVVRSILANVNTKVSSEFHAAHPKTYVSSGAKGFSRVRETFEAPLVTLMIGVALLLGIICANVANLLLARAIARGREMSVRLALGANRTRLVRQLLTEAAVLSIVSAAAGLLVARGASRWLITLAAGGAATSVVGDGLSPTVLAFTLAVSIVAVGVFGLAPALHATRIDLATSMRAGAQAVTGSAPGLRGRRRPLGSLLIVGQVSLSVVLLVGAAILARSLSNLQSVDVGFDRDHLVIADLDINARGYVGTPLANLVHSLRDRVAAIPGIRDATFSENGIFSGSDSHTSIAVPGFTARTADDTMIAYDNVGAGYARAIGAHLVAGRDLLASDENKPARVALVTRGLVDFYFPHQDGIGKYIRFSDSIDVQIVGVIADARDHRLTGVVDRRLYFPYVHTDTNSSQLGNPGALRLEVRTAGDPAAVVDQIRKAIVAVDPSLPNRRDRSASEPDHEPDPPGDPAHPVGHGVRRAGARVGRDRPVWRDELFRRAPLARDGFAHGARRTTRRRHPPRLDQRTGARALGARRGVAARRGDDPAAQVAAARRRHRGSGLDCRCRRGTGR